MPKSSVSIATDNGRLPSRARNWFRIRMQKRMYCICTTSSNIHYFKLNALITSPSVFPTAARSPPPAKQQSAFRAPSSSTAAADSWSIQRPVLLPKNRTKMPKAALPATVAPRPLKPTTLPASTPPASIATSPTPNPICSRSSATRCATNAATRTARMR